MSIPLIVTIVVKFPDHHNRRITKEALSAATEIPRAVNRCRKIEVAGSW
jgi:hypothetical protein